MKCSLFQCHSHYYYETACLVLTDDEEFEKNLRSRRKKGELYFLYEKAINKIVIETKRECHILSEHENIEKVEAKNQSELDSEEFDDINLILKKSGNQNMFKKNKWKEAKRVVLPFFHNKNRIFSHPETESDTKKKGNVHSDRNKYNFGQSESNRVRCVEEESDLENGRNYERNNESKKDELIENFKEDLCNGLNNYFEDIFKKTETKEENKKRKAFIRELNLNDNDAVDHNFDDDNLLSQILTSSSLNFQNSSLFSIPAKNRKQWEKQKKHSVVVPLSEHNLAIFNKKKKEEEERRQQIGADLLTGDLECYSSMASKSLETYNFKGEEVTEENVRIASNPFSSFYMKNKPKNLCQKKKYENTEKRKRINSSISSNNKKLKTVNKNEEVYSIKSRKRKKERPSLEFRESSMFSEGVYRRSVDILEEMERVRCKQLLNKNRKEHANFTHSNFNRTVENIVRNNEVYNNRKILQNRKSQIMSMKEDCDEEENEDFMFDHFQKNVNNKILNKIFYKY